MDLIMQQNRKILLVDDEARIVDELFKVLTPQELGNDELVELEDHLFGTSESNKKQTVSYDVCRCQQGDEAICEVQKALEKEQPFAVAFIDVQMPPGPDGVATAEQIRKIDPNIQIVIITGHSDFDVCEISERIPPEDKLLFLQKPVHSQEITQFALALTAKWQSDHLLRKQNETLIETNQSLKENIELRKELESQLKHTAEE
jgi:DNA-binding NtrC family response regulator